jgi:hypothetical protein
MYELDGRQYLLVTASTAAARGAGSGTVNGNAAQPAHPTGIIAYALPRN